MPLFYTGKGDAGVSHIGEKKISKDSPALEALGDLDELNSLLGVARSRIQDEELAGKLKRVQEALFIIQARCAWIMFPEHEAKELAQTRIEELEKEIDAIEEAVHPERGFIVPGASPLAATLDYIRAVSRRAERKIDALHKTNELPPAILAYMNRLSSYLYALARHEAFKANVQESRPTYQ